MEESHEKKGKKGKATTTNSRKNLKVGSIEQITPLSILRPPESCPSKARGIGYFFFLNSFIMEIRCLLRLIVDEPNAHKI